MFIPKRIIFEKDVLEYDLGKEIQKKFKNKNIEMIQLASNHRKEAIPGGDLTSLYQESKKTLVVGIKKGFKFQSCKPSAHYQLPLVSGCMGQCEYCYLNTMLGDRPFVKIYVNVDEILTEAEKYIEKRLPEFTIFEGAATSDPVPVEPYSHSLEQSILFFGKNNHGKFRFVTKYTDIDTLLSLEHNGNTEIRFSLNTPRIINQYEHYTASADKRIEASVKAAMAGYPVGYLIAPVFIYENWKEDYHNLFLHLQNKLNCNLKYPITFEIISHRYTLVAKNRIIQVFPDTTLPLIEEERKLKYGQFGYSKYIYPGDVMEEMKEFFSKELATLFQNGVVKYII